MNPILQISATCSHCSVQHQLSDCLSQRVVTPPTSWPTSPGSIVIEFTCPDCSELVYTHTLQ